MAEAIEWVEEELNDAIKYQLNDRACVMDTIITALQAYQPWVSVETGCRKINVLVWFVPMKKCLSISIMDFRRV